MGLIRGSLHIFTYGAVSAKSKKQRMASMQLAALQGKSPAAIKAAGGRNFDFANNDKARRVERREAGQRSQPAKPPSPGWPHVGGWNATQSAVRFAVTMQVGVLRPEELPGWFRDRRPR